MAQEAEAHGEKMIVQRGSKRRGSLQRYRRQEAKSGSSSGRNGGRAEQAGNGERRWSVAARRGSGPILSELDETPQPHAISASARPPPPLLVVRPPTSLSSCDAQRRSSSAKWRESAISSAGESEAPPRGGSGEGGEREGSTRNDTWRAEREGRMDRGERRDG